MIGNDIVDWAQASRDSNWQRRGFLSKLFTLSEQQLIHEANHPERMVWTLWSVKESVYKAHLRQTGQRRFAPQKIQCRLQPTQTNLVEGTATYEFTYQIRASLTPDYVSSTAVLSGQPLAEQEQIIHFQSSDYIYQHVQLRRSIIHYCTTVLACSPDVLIHKNDQGVPSLTLCHTFTPLCLPISLSHHGHYGAFIIDCSAFKAE